MVQQLLNEQDAASMTGPRVLKEPGEILWCWQTISALQSMWKSLNLAYDQYMRTWAEAEEHAIWEKIPPDNPFGTKDAMLEQLDVGDEVAAKARVAVQAIASRPLKRHGGHLSRIARDYPEIFRRMQNGEFSSVAAAAREAGIMKPRTKTVSLSPNVERVAGNIKKHYTPEQLATLIEALQQGSGASD